MKPFRSFIFATIIVLIFFVFLETVLRFSGFQPTIRFKQFALPAWMEELDPFVLAKYQSFVVEQGFVNEDAYAYKPDLRYGYLLKPNLKITVSNYSSAIFLDKLPPWKIESNSKEVTMFHRTLDTVAIKSPTGRGHSARRPKS